MTILGICDVPDILKVVRIVKVIITIIRIAIPILLIIMCMIDGVKATMSGELGELGKTLIRRAIAALLIFFVPLFVSLIVKTIAPNSEYTKCLNNASKDKIVDSYNNQMEELVKRQIPLEICPKSNLDTKTVKSFKELPIKEFFLRNIVVTINTDDMSVSNTTLKNEYRILSEELGMYDSMLRRIAANTIRSAFLSDKEKEELLALL